MADNYIKVADLNPLNFVDANRSLPANYHFKHFDKWKTSEQLLPFEVAPGYSQKWQQDDIINLQVMANFGPVNVYVIDSDGIAVITQAMNIVATVVNDNYFECSIALTGLTGCYKVRITAGDPVQTTLESESFSVAATQPETLLYKYSNNFNNDIYFQSGIYFNLRVEGCLSDFVPSGNRVVYLDQPQNSKTVKGVSSRQFKLYIGSSEGVPDYIADKIQKIFDLNNVDIDGVGFSAIEGAKLTPKREEQYQYAGWSLDVSPTINRGGKIFTSTGIQDKKIIMEVFANNKLFGPIGTPVNDNTIIITELN